MKVKITSALKGQMLSDGLDPNELARRFAEWKEGDEYGSYLFGKDSAYVKPLVDGAQYALRHVHLVPLADMFQLAAWDKAWGRRGRKTSDRCLVYVKDTQGTYLLIFILSEPDAHTVAQMKDSQCREIMEGFANVAAHFLDTGAILC